MADLKAILADPNYVSANPATKRAIFDKRVAADPAYLQANPATQAAIRKKFGLEEAAPAAPAEPQRSVGQYLYETAANVPASAGAMLGGMYEAVTHPVQTAKGLGLAAYGGARNVAEAALPTSAFEAIKSVENPEVAKQAVEVANAIGGIYKDRYGSIDQLLDTIRTDPVGAASDLSVLFSGGAAATTKLGTVSNVLAKTGRVLDPVGALVGKTVETGGRLAAGTVNRLATSAQTRFVNEMAAGKGPALVRAARTSAAYPGTVPTFAEATVDVGAPRVQAVGAKAEKIQPEAEVARAKSLQDKMLADLETISGTPAQRDAMAAARDAQAKTDYGKAFPKVVQEDATLTDLLQRPSTRKAFNRAVKLARESGETFNLAAGVTGAPAEYTVRNLHRVKQAMDDLLTNPERFGIGASEAKAIGDTRTEFLNWLEHKVPDYKTARQNYATASKELARKEWGDFISQKLTSAMSADAPLRGRNFANAVRASLSDKTGPAALRRAVGGGSRYSDLRQLLTPTEMNIVEDIVGQLGREEKAAALAAVGREAAPSLKAVPEPGKRPQMLDRVWTIAGAVYDRVAGQIGKKKAEQLALAMLNADTMADIIEKAVKSQKRADIVAKPLRAAGELTRKGARTPVGVAASSAAGRFETEENRNAFLTDALGRSYDIQGNAMAR
jgi:hypothetical protein